MGICNKKPSTLEEYKKWLKAELGIELSESDRKRYQTLQSKIKHDIENSACWRELNKEFRNYRDEYYSTHNGFDLFTKDPSPELLLKPFESLVDKTFRKNVIENKNWPIPPSSGWIGPANWFSTLNDIIRTLLVVKYLDGVDFLISKMCNYCERNGVQHLRPSFEAKETGYYAVHFYILQEFEIPNINWDTEKIPGAIEIQVTTQLQETIRVLLHKYYDKRRILIEKEPTKWQWDYKCEEFAANYLGHILHYVEGMIMEIREKQLERKP